MILLLLFILYIIAYIMEPGGVHSVPSSAQRGSNHLFYVPKESLQSLQRDFFRQEGEQEGACGYPVVT